MSESAFDGQILSEKLSKLNSSQQSIESLSRWCISHRKKARQIVETWDKLFKSAQKEQRVSFLYLSNDILQNSRRKGSEFVNEFWKVLPATLKNVYESGDENGKKAAFRLVDIWEERKVFGSRGQNLKDELMGKNPLPPPLVSNGKSSNPIKIVKRDAHSLRIKLAVGGMPEKILTGFQLVHDENVNEEAALNKCKGAVSRVGEIERDVESASTQGNLQGSAALVGEIQEQENVLQQCASQLESAEATRAALVSQLKEALQDQESKLELIRSQLQVVHGQIDQATNMREKLLSPIPSPPITTFKPPPVEPTRAVEPNLLPVQLNSLAPPAQPMMTFSSTKITEEESKKAAAAAVAAKLAASTSSAQMLTSVLSSLVAEEAAKSAGFSSLFSPEKRQKLEKPMQPSDSHNPEAANSPYYTLQQQTMANVSLAQPPPPPPPPPPVQSSNSPVNQFVQNAGLMMGMMPYGYAANSLPPPPPLPSHPPHISMGLTRPALQPPQSPQQQHQHQQQQTGNSGYYRPPGIGFYGQSHQPTPPPVPRQ